MKQYLRTYIAYIKDNPERYWFKRKLYGWGWTPATTEGWLVTIAFALLIAVNFLHINATAETTNDVIRPFVFQTILLLIALIAICYEKGERPRWQWGIPKKDSETSSRE